MLVLTRQPNERIIIGADKKIVITVVSVNGNKVRLGIKADPDVPVHREEVLEKIEAANKS